MRRTPLVEDEGVTALDLKSELTTLGYQVVGIEDNARDAVRAAAELKPDLILMDIRIAGDVDGIMAASVIRDKVGQWQPIEIYIRDRSEAKFSHSLCPACAKEYLPEVTVP